MAVNRNKNKTPAPPADGTETVTAPAEEKNQPLQKPAEKSAGFCVYIGPTIPGVIQSGHTYNGPRAKVLEEISDIAKERPLVASLLVDGLTLAVDRIKVKTPGNLLFVNYKKLASGETK